LSAAVASLLGGGDGKRIMCKHAATVLIGIFCSPVTRVSIERHRQWTATGLRMLVACCAVEVRNRE